MCRTLSQLRHGRGVCAGGGGVGGEEGGQGGHRGETEAARRRQV